MRALVFGVIVFSALGAAAAPGGGESSLNDDEPSRSAGLEVAGPPPIMSPADVFELDGDMRAFAAAIGPQTHDTPALLRRLLAAMEARGLFALEYDEEVTHTARDTFHERRGNCLSFTMLFVALAREVGLSVHYQLVDVPPTWAFNDDLIVYGSHINALITAPFQPDYTVDFNLVKIETEYPAVVISDDYVLALFYSNLGAEALLRKEYDLSFRYLRAAIETHRRYAGPWVNLGVLYGRLGDLARAETAYQRALSIDRENPSALSNLANLYRKLGDQESAEELQRRVRRYQLMNPYYHYALAEAAYERQEFEPALDALRKAVRLKSDEYRFYELQGLAFSALGKPSNAARSFLKAKSYAVSSELKARYSSLADAQRNPD